MAATYFSLPSFAKAKKHTEELAKTSPVKPILNDEDEKFLERVTSNGNEQVNSTTEAHISDDGVVKETSKKTNDDQVIFPGKQPNEIADDPPESVPEDESEAPALPPRPTPKKDAFVELPSQEEAEAATKGFSTTVEQGTKTDEKKSWASYIPSIPTLSRDSSAKQSDDKDSRTWSQYASTMVASVPSVPLPSLPASWTRSKDAKPDPVLNDDGSINEEATKEKEEKEVSVLLDNLNLSSINNRVFAFSEESQKFYERFVQALKDTINGVPTAYDDMEKLMKEAGPTIERQWNAMPPFVQTLVKALPAKLSTSVAPGLMAALGEKPGDAKAMNAANSKATSGGDPAIKSKSKKKRQIVPGLKGLVKKQGLAATMLQNISMFLKTRFPFLASASSVLMSLSVFILMFVFYYCWRRGRDVRLAKEKEIETQSKDGAEDDEDDDTEVDVTDEESSEAAEGTDDPSAQNVKTSSTVDDVPAEGKTTAVNESKLQE